MSIRKPYSMVPKSAQALALVVALWAVALGTAQANGAPSVLGIDAVGTPGSNASIRFEFDFGASLPITAAVFSLNWDPALLKVLGVSTVYQGLSVDAAAALAAVGTYTPLFSPDVGNFGALWSALDSNDQPLPALELAGLATLSIDVMLAPAFPMAQSTSVNLSLLLADRAGIPLDELAGTARITAVPEPAQWAMLLAGGLGMVGAARYRRSAAR